MTLQRSSQSDFRATRWSLIRDVNADGTNSRSQLNELCLRYWTPIHQHILRSGRDEAAARELTKSFFTVLQHDGLARASRHSRFRDFLTSELEGFLERDSNANEGSALDRVASMADASGAVKGAPVDPPNLERGFALEVLAQSMARLRKEAVDAGHPEMFERLQRYLSQDARPQDIEHEADAMTAKPLFVSMAIRRLRQRFRRIVDDELTQLVTNPEQLAEERAAMLIALGRAK